MQFKAADRLLYHTTCLGFLSGTLHYVVILITFFSMQKKTKSIYKEKILFSGQATLRLCKHPEEEYLGTMIPPANKSSTKS